QWPVGGRCPAPGGDERRPELPAAGERTIARPHHDHRSLSFSPVATRLILIRHGHTANNSGGDARLIGRTDVALSDRGEDELRRLCERLRGARPFDAIYSSPLQRAWRIAMALEELGLGSVRRCDGLVEIDCGTLDGRRVEEVKREHPELWEANVRQRDEHFRWPGGESYREFRC